MLQEAFEELYPTRTLPDLRVQYSAKFKAYNATVHIAKRGRSILSLEFRLSRKFEDVDESIQKGIIQHLLNRVYKTNVQTLEQQLYTSFLEKVTRYAPKIPSDTYLISRFEKLNAEYFSGMLERPNLVFGQEATTVLGHYNFNTDTITLSPVMQEREDLLDFVLYHEMLHKKHGVKKTASGRNHYHTPAFRRDEKLFKVPNVEKELERFIRRKKVKKLFSWF